MIDEFLVRTSVPTVMPVDRERWRGELNFSNFINTACQYRDVNMLGDVEKILIVGPGQGLDTAVFKWQGFKISTIDIDETFEPDYIGSVHDMPMFSDKQFDVVIASHVLEHLPVTYLDDALREIARVGHAVLIYLPVAGRHFQFRLIPSFKGLDLTLIFDFFNYLHKPDGKYARFCEGQHYWELGMRGFRKRDLIRRFLPYFEVVKGYRNRDWLPSYNFVLRTI